MGDTYITTLLPLWLTSKPEVEALAGDVTGRQDDANVKGR
nr:MAG TPA: hypothetical protein [Caudoviricetes sp.]